MADASARNGPHGSSFHVSGSQLLVRTSPDPPRKRKACPRTLGRLRHGQNNPIRMQGTQSLGSLPQRPTQHPEPAAGGM